jgi:hypothetical protein
MNLDRLNGIEFPLNWIPVCNFLNIQKKNEDG